MNIADCYSEKMVLYLVYGSKTEKQSKAIKKSFFGSKIDMLVYSKLGIFKENLIWMQYFQFY